MYDMNDLVSFVKLVESGSLTETARSLGVSKSTLSRRITHLENDVGQPLLLRQSNKLHLNEAGQAFYPFARQILEAARTAQEQVDSLKASVTGDLNVGVFSGLIRSWFPKEIINFSEQYPEVRLSLKAVTQCAEADQFDVTVWLGTPELSRLKEELIGNLTCSLYASRSYLARQASLNSVDDLARVDWVNMHHFYQPAGDLELHHGEDGTRTIQIPKSRVWTDQIAMQLESIVRSNGMGVLPDYMVRMREQHHPGD
ncbi:LysR family transcriptional regulator [Oceanimonas doudoroffii]|nr:LysR family transcriptional regulator [Oceanimonas doudoroffii]